MAGNSASAPFSVTTAIILGLLASFVQSLGLTIQRKSHLVNESLAPVKRRTEWKRPLWLLGFAIFLVANIGGTVFQIGALPIVMLAPLGAVSLLYNAVLARFLLNDLLSKYMIMGTALIASGAVMIGYFGVVPSPPHDLDELLDLYARPTFVAFATIFTFLFVGVLTVSHLAQWQLHARMHRPDVASKPVRPKYRGSGSRGRLRRRWSAPTLAPVVEVSESSSGIATPVLAIQDEAARRSSNLNRQHAAPLTNAGSSVKRDYGSFPRSEALASKRRKRVSSSVVVPRLELRETEQRLDAETIKRTRLGLAVAFGGASGTLSGACLLLAKSGVELLILTFSGQNQFGRWQSWFLIGVLLAAALLQLWYLNKALKLADPTLVCPLAFCFYNTASIALGLVYFDQLGALAWYDMLFVAIGTGVLLSGVWIVSLHGSNDDDDDESAEEETESLLSSPSTAASTQDFESLIAANAAGITGPHLPPAQSLSPSSSHASAFAESSSALVESPPTSPTVSRLRSSSSSSLQNNNGSVKKRRSGSHAGHMHQRRPTITLDFPLGDGFFSPPSSSSPMFQPMVQGDVESAGVSNVTAGDSADTSLISRRNPSLYNTILEHGLSIGISPSSPGFYLQPRSPSFSRPRTRSSSWKCRPLRAPQRSMSEADVEASIPFTASGTDADATVADSSAAMTPASTSGFGVLIDRFDLSRRLDSLGFGRGQRKPRRWWTKLWSAMHDDDDDNDASAEPLLDSSPPAPANQLTRGLRIDTTPPPRRTS